MRRIRIGIRVSEIAVALNYHACATTSAFRCHHRLTIRSKTHLEGRRQAQPHPRARPGGALQALGVLQEVGGRALVKIRNTIALICIGIAGGISILNAAANSSDARVLWRSEATDMEKARDGGTCDRCFLLAVFGRHLSVPNRFIVQAERKIADGCVALVAPVPVPGAGLGTAEYKLALETQSGLVRYCPRQVLDPDIRKLEAMSKPTSVRVVDRVTIKTWSAASLRSQFTTTYIYSGENGLLVSDVNPRFGELLWATGQSTQD
jgi:hypothetical protein